MIDEREISVALTVLHAVKSQSEMKNHAWVESYSNWREQGFCICALTDQYVKKVAFSENRNSDNIVVYYGRIQDFDMQGNCPSEKIYRERKLFDYDKPYQAAQSIVEYLSGE